MKKTILVSALMVAGLTGHALAQTAPDAGQTLQELTRPPLAPLPSRPIDLQRPADAAVAPGGASVQVSSITFTGNTAFTEQELRAALSDAPGKRFDLAGLRGLAERVSELYRVKGYPFARALIPQQQLADGVLNIRILEGRYGQVSARGEPAMVEGATPFLGALQPGGLIHGPELERSILILDDLPGVRVTPTVSPGADVGTGDLVVDVVRERRVGGVVGVDNAGNRFTGSRRARASVFFDSPFLFGDRVTLDGLVSNGDLWLGGAAYELPLGARGLRGQVAYTRTNYELGREFASLDASGRAEVTSARLSYPVVRSQQSNVLAALGVQHKKLEDRFGAVGTVDGKQSRGVTLGAQFDHRDSLGGGGITYGALGLTVGELDLDASLAASDAATAGSQGRFRKQNLDLARIQNVAGPVSFYGRLSVQHTRDNLDSSEKVSIGGLHGVRAYPQGEGLGDRAALAQLELRLATGVATPFAFYDLGRTTVNARPWDASANERSLAGTGVGVRLAEGSWLVELAAAWRVRGGVPTAEPGTTQPRFWVNAAYRF